MYDTCPISEIGCAKMPFLKKNYDAFFILISAGREH